MSIGSDYTRAECTQVGGVKRGDVCYGPGMLRAAAGPIETRGIETTRKSQVLAPSAAHATYEAKNSFFRGGRTISGCFFVFRSVFYHNKHPRDRPPQQICRLPPFLVYLQTLRIGGFNSLRGGRCRTLNLG